MKEFVHINAGGCRHDWLDPMTVYMARGTMSPGLESRLFCRDARTLGTGSTAGFDLPHCCCCWPPLCPSPHVGLSYISVWLCLTILRVKFDHCYQYGEWDVQIIKCGLIFSLDRKPHYFSSD